jgi:hypothetical protein
MDTLRGLGQGIKITLAGVTFLAGVTGLIAALKHGQLPTCRLEAGLISSRSRRAEGLGAAKDLLRTQQPPKSRPLPRIESKQPHRAS